MGKRELGGEEQRTDVREIWWQWFENYGGIEVFGMYSVKILEYFYYYSCFVFIFVYSYLLVLLYYYWSRLFNIIYWLKCQSDWLVHSLSIFLELLIVQKSFFEMSGKRTWVRWDGGTVVFGMWPKKNRVRGCIFFYMYVLFIHYCHWIIYINYLLLYIRYTSLYIFFSTHICNANGLGCNESSWRDLKYFYNLNSRIYTVIFWIIL